MITYFIITVLALLITSACAKLSWLARGQREWKASHEAVDVVLHVALVAWGAVVLSKVV